MSVPGWASSVTPQSSASDPAEAEALRCLEQGTAKLEDGDVLGAKELYKRSCEIHRNASSLFNLGVTHFHLSMSLSFCIRKLVLKRSTEEYDDAISAWKESISLQPSSPDAHTSVFLLHSNFVSVTKVSTVRYRKCISPCPRYGFIP